MRKILLGTTAVVGAALLAPSLASAQEAPTVRIGGYFRAYYGYTQQTSTGVTGNIGGVAGATSATGPTTFSGGTSVFSAQNIGDGGLSGSTSLTTTSVTAGVPQAAGTTNTTGSVSALGSGTLNAGLPNNGTNGSAAQSARLGHHDFSTDAEIHVFVNGKTANGLTYGAVVEIQFDANEGLYRAARRSYTSKTMADIDEMYAFIASPTLGQIRFGDEDGPFGGLMNAGIVTNFGTGGIYGDWQDFVVRPNRTTTSPGDVGDNTKIIYLSPQFFGFDFGASWAFNEGTGADTGCVDSRSGPYCDRVYASQGVTAFGRATENLPGRRNELQLMARYRGSFAGVGIAASFGYMTSGMTNDITVFGAQRRTLRPIQLWQAGLQATAYGFTVGANYMWGQSSFFYIPQVRGDQSMTQLFVGGSYTVGPFSIGANGFFGTYAGTAGSTFNVIDGGLRRNTNGSQRGQRRYGYSVGANYRIAPGLDLVAEYVRHVVHENGFDLDLQANNGVQDKLRADVFIVGTRLAF